MINITNIDKIEPKSFTLTVLDIGTKRIKIEAKTQDEEESLENAQSGIERYEYYMNGLKIDETNEEVHELTNLSKNTNYTIYVIAYDKAGNPKQSDSINVTTLEGGDYPTLTLNGMQQGEDLAPDALPAVAYDNNFSTYAIAVYNNVYTRYLKVDSECWGKYITLYNINNSSSLGGSIGFNKTNDKTGDYEGDWMSKLCGLTSRNKCARSVVIPEGTNWIALSSGTSNTQVSNYIYEVWCSEEDLTGKTY